MVVGYCAVIVVVVVPVVIERHCVVNRMWIGAIVVCCYCHDYIRGYSPYC